MLNVTRSRIYYQKRGLTAEEVRIMNTIHDIYTEHPFYGYRRIHVSLVKMGYTHNIKKTQRLMRVMGLKGLCPRKKTTLRNKAHSIFPYLLSGLKIERPNQVWQVDITYIKTRSGFIYLVGIIDVYSRKIMGWALSVFLDTNSCLKALEMALKIARPEILNSDQGCQFTSNEWIAKLKSEQILVSMDGKGRWADNINIERFWRSLKWEAVYLNCFDTVEQARVALEQYINFYNCNRPHQALNYKEPDQFYNEWFNAKKDFPVQLIHVIDGSANQQLGGG